MYKEPQVLARWPSEHPIVSLRGLGLGLRVRVAHLGLKAQQHHARNFFESLVSASIVGQLSPQISAKLAYH